jgi:hypothetical protein
VIYRVKCEMMSCGPTYSEHWHKQQSKALRASILASGFPKEVFIVHVILSRNSTNHLIAQVNQLMKHTVVHKMPQKPVAACLQIHRKPPRAAYEKWLGVSGVQERKGKLSRAMGKSFNVLVQH